MSTLHLVCRITSHRRLPYIYLLLAIGIAGERSSAIAAQQRDVPTRAQVMNALARTGLTLDTVYYATADTVVLGVERDRIGKRLGVAKLEGEALSWIYGPIDIGDLSPRVVWLRLPTRAASIPSLYIESYYPTEAVIGRTVIDLVTALPLFVYPPYTCYASVLRDLDADGAPELVVYTEQAMDFRRCAEDIAIRPFSEVGLPIAWPAVYEWNDEAWVPVAEDVGDFYAELGERYRELSGWFGTICRGRRAEPLCTQADEIGVDRQLEEWRARAEAMTVER